ncbi:hypothetical protein [Bradyrhizobium icense]|uniref:hypothetical protein n=1 Tax=Bradyrhizobium icense TaxID=1274631 RepID=UPI0012EA6A04|nr:hypothetical protein [Bradyrhizobium icense]
MTAPTWNSLLNLWPFIAHLRLHETPNLDVHQTGSSSKWLNPRIPVVELDRADLDHSEESFQSIHPVAVGLFRLSVRCAVGSLSVGWLRAVVEQQCAH